MPPGRALALALIPGVAIALGLHFAVLGLRPHLLTLLGEPRLLFKLCLTFLLAALSGALVARIARPGADIRRISLMLAIVPALLAAAGLAELLAVPAAEWGLRLVGTNAIFCLKSIPFLAAARSLPSCWPCVKVHRSIPPLPERRPASSPGRSARRATPRIARMIRRFSWRPGIHWRLASSPPSAPRRGDGCCAGEQDPPRCSDLALDGAPGRVLS